MTPGIFVTGFAFLNVDWKQFLRRIGIQLNPESIIYMRGPYWKIICPRSPKLPEAVRKQTKLIFFFLSKDIFIIETNFVLIFPFPVDLCVLYKV